MGNDICTQCERVVKSATEFQVNIVSHLPLLMFHCSTSQQNEKEEKKIQSDPSQPKENLKPTSKASPLSAKTSFPQINPKEANKSNDSLVDLPGQVKNQSKNQNEKNEKAHYTLPKNTHKEETTASLQLQSNPKDTRTMEQDEMNTGNSQKIETIESQKEESVRTEKKRSERTGNPISKPNSQKESKAVENQEPNEAQRSKREENGKNGEVFPVQNLSTRKLEYYEVEIRSKKNNILDLKTEKKKALERKRRAEQRSNAQNEKMSQRGPSNRKNETRGSQTAFSRITRKKGEENGMDETRMSARSSKKNKFEINEEDFMEEIAQREKQREKNSKHFGSQEDHEGGHSLHSEGNRSHREGSQKHDEGNRWMDANESQVKKEETKSDLEEEKTQNEENSTEKVNDQSQNDKKEEPSPLVKVRREAIRLRDNSIYDGEWLGPVREGFGQLTYPDGSVYIGEFKENMRNGKGKLISGANREIFDGVFKNDQIEGYGKFKSASLEYEGEWKAGLFSGFGRLVIPEENVYEGNFEFGKRKGNGKMVFQNGEMYQGQWEEDQPNGFVVFRIFLALTISGFFVDREFTTTKTIEFTKAIGSIIRKKERANWHLETGESSKGTSKGTGSMARGF